MDTAQLKKQYKEQIAPYTASLTVLYPLLDFLP